MYDDGMYESVVMNFIAILDDHRGFDDWWYNIDDEIRDEIITDLIWVVKDTILKG